MEKDFWKSKPFITLKELIQTMQARFVMLYFHVNASLYQRNKWLSAENLAIERILIKFFSGVSPVDCTAVLGKVALDSAHIEGRSTRLVSVHAGDLNIMRSLQYTLMTFVVMNAFNSTAPYMELNNSLSEF
jgi:hypothetical protein